MGVKDIDHVRRYTAQGFLIPTSEWAPYYPQTNGYWSHDGTPLVGAGYYGWNGHLGGGYDDAFNYYDIAGEQRRNVTYIGDGYVDSHGKIISREDHFESSGSGIYYFNPEDDPDKRGIPKTLTLMLAGSSSIMPVLSGKSIPYGDPQWGGGTYTWEELKHFYPNSAREIVDSTGHFIIGVEPANSWRANTTYQYEYNISSYRS